MTHHAHFRMHGPWGQLCRFSLNSWLDTWTEFAGTPASSSICQEAAHTGRHGLKVFVQTAVTPNWCVQNVCFLGDMVHPVSTAEPTVPNWCNVACCLAQHLAGCAVEFQGVRLCHTPLLGMTRTQRTHMQHMTSMVQILLQGKEPSQIRTGPESPNQPYPPPTPDTPSPRPSPCMPHTHMPHAHAHHMDAPHGRHPRHAMPCHAMPCQARSGADPRFGHDTRQDVHPVLLGAHRQPRSGAGPGRAAGVQ